MINLKKSIHFLFCLCLSETLDLRNTNLLEIYFCTLFEKKNGRNDEQLLQALPCGI